MYDIDSHLADLLIRNGRAMGRLFGAKIEALGINASDAPILISLWTSDGRKQVDIAEFVGVEPAALTRPLDRLEAAGIVERRACINDRRAYAVHLTEKGQKLRKNVQKIRDELENRLGAGLSQAEINALKHSLVQTFSILEEDVRILRGRA